eukprot:TRINITY_DN794_c0_g1_i11.p2 TRINITY_DN794_c0_g1~~TRINITY_DN794_c0_g1_i11.p2  ORF type:complete len:114 (-),score=21.92 TRINITY_DN794_c0_g1_i11:265-606(-)
MNPEPHFFMRKISILMVVIHPQAWPSLDVLDPFSNQLQGECQYQHQYSSSFSLSYFLEVVHLQVAHCCLNHLPPLLGLEWRKNLMKRSDNSSETLVDQADDHAICCDLFVFFV